jgi:hypothetical protein
MSLLEANACQEKVDPYNSERVPYNEFKRKCMKDNSANQRTSNVRGGGAAGGGLLKSPRRRI